MANPKTVWLGARAGRWSEETVGYEIGLRKKGFDSGTGFSNKYYIEGFCREDFERITGFKMKPGEVKKVRIIIEEV